MMRYLLVLASTIVFFVLLLKAGLTSDVALSEDEEKERTAARLGSRLGKPFLRRKVERLECICLSFDTFLLLYGEDPDKWRLHRNYAEYNAKYVSTKDLPTQSGSPIVRISHNKDPFLRLWEEIEAGLRQADTIGLATKKFSFEDGAETVYFAFPDARKYRRWARDLRWKEAEKKFIEEAEREKIKELEQRKRRISELQDTMSAMLATANASADLAQDKIEEALAENKSCIERMENNPEAAMGADRPGELVLEVTHE